MSNLGPRHRVIVTYTAYPLAPNTGYASERHVEVHDALGLVATVAPSLTADATARTMAAALSQCQPEAVAVVTRYRYRDGRRAVSEHILTESEERIRYTPSCAISRHQYEALLWPTDLHTLSPVLASIRRALISPYQHVTDEARREHDADGEAS